MSSTCRRFEGNAQRACRQSFEYCNSSSAKYNEEACAHLCGAVGHMARQGCDDYTRMKNGCWYGEQPTRAQNALGAAGAAIAVDANAMPGVHGKKAKAALRATTPAAKAEALDTMAAAKQAMVVAKKALPAEVALDDTLLTAAKAEAEALMAGMVAGNVGPRILKPRPSALAPDAAVARAVAQTPGGDEVVALTETDVATGVDANGGSADEGYWYYNYRPYGGRYRWGSGYQGYPYRRCYCSSYW